MNTAKFKSCFFYKKPLAAAFMPTQKARRGRHETNPKKGKKIQMKQENENISFDFYLHVVVMAMTEIQKLYKY